MLISLPSPVVGFGWDLDRFVWCLVGLVWQIIRPIDNPPKNKNSLQHSPQITQGKPTPLPPKTLGILLLLILQPKKQER